MRRVLVVDDDDEIRETMIDVLEQLGHTPEGAANGLEALQKARRGPPPCLVLLDLMMPVMDGRSFLEAQLHDPTISDVPVLLISAFSDVQATAASMRVAGWLRKPLDLGDLAREVSKHCS
jgi:CheY-like chemotaxis protein